MKKKLTNLLILRFNQLAVPLIVYPFSISILGLEAFGFIAFWVALSAFLSKLTSMNMESYCARLIVNNKENKYLLRKYTLMPVYIKVSFTLMIFPFYVLYASIATDNYIQFITAILCSYPLIKSMFSLAHLFIGIGDFKVLMYTSLLENIIFILCIFLFIRTEEDYFFYPLSFIFSLLFSISSVFYFSGLKKFKIDLYVFFRTTKEYFEVGKWLLLGKSLQLHMNAAKPIVGLFLGYSAVAVYDVAEKIVNLSKVPFSMVSDALFSEDKNSTMFYFKISMVSFILSVVGYVFLVFFGEFLLLYLTKNQYTEEMLSILRVLAVILFFTPQTLLLGQNYIVKRCDKKLYGKLLVSSNLLSSLLLVIWAGFYSDSIFTFAWWVVACECLFFIHCLFAFLYYRKLRKNAH